MARTRVHEVQERKTAGAPGRARPLSTGSTPFFLILKKHMGVSENRLVPLNPMVNDTLIPFLNGYFIGNIPYFQTNPYGVSRKEAIIGNSIYDSQP